MRAYKTIIKGFTKVLNLIKSAGALLATIGAALLFMFVRKSGRQEIENEYLASQVEQAAQREEVNKQLQEKNAEIDASAPATKSKLIDKLRRKGL